VKHLNPRQGITTERGAVRPTVWMFAQV